MKRILQVALTLALALALMLPVAAIANIDGSEPEWDGYAGIRPMSDELVIDGVEFANDDAYDYYTEENEPNRAQFARDGDVDTIDVPELQGSGINAVSDYLEIDPISAELSDSSVPVVLVYVGLGVAVLALVLAIVALVKKK